MNRNGNETESFAGNFVASDEQGLFFEVTCSLLLAFVPHLSPTPSSRHRASGHHRRRRSAGGYSLYALSVPVSAAPAFLPNMPFRLDADFVPVIKI